MSDPHNHRSSDVIASDTDVGGDADQPGISQPVTQADIDDIVNDVHMPIEERIERLKALTAQFDTRENVDRGGDTDPLLWQLDEAMNMLAEGGHTYGTVEAAGLDPDARSDARAPDDFDSDERR